MCEEKLIPYTLYLHSGKESMYDDGSSLGLEGEALHNFMYTGYEVALEGVVHKDSGTFFVKKINDTQLEKQIEI